jgi:pSer/pThr/pTyr-binding forkhead associated (FHA) protein
MPAQLVALNEGPNILLDKPILLVGRHPECDIQIDSRKISRRHCCIAQVNDAFLVRDLESTNGIRINGEKVSEGRLTHGDELTIGNHRYQVNTEALVGGPPQGRSKDTVRPPISFDDDDPLESCDEPVPLAESGSPIPTPRPKVPPPTPRQESFILPDSIELRPSSDVFPKLPNSSGSHPGV